MVSRECKTKHTDAYNVKKIYYTTLPCLKNVCLNIWVVGDAMNSHILVGVYVGFACWTTSDD